jgi:hypothetical protein
MLTRVLLAIVLLGAAPAMAQAPEERYLPDLMEQQPAYLTARKKMVAGEKLPAWVNTFTKTQGAVAAPVKTITVAGRSYTLGWICKPHDCGGNEVYALFDPEARQAWGLLISDGKRRWLGKPDAAVQAAIQSGVE